MKRNKIILSIVAAAATLTACNDLDQLPNTSVVTEGQKEDVVQLNPALAAAGVNALPEQITAYYSIFENHIDYGLASSYLAIETRGQDMPSPNVGYNWYSPALEYSDFNGRYYLNLMCWYYNYYTIRSANSVLGTVVDNGDPEFEYFRAQAYTYRAFCYFNLAQMYQFSFSKNPEALCVPILTEENMTEAAANGCPRATVREVYAQINSDLTEAIRLFTHSAEEGCTRETMAESANIIKTFANLTTAYGLRARANLFRQEWQAAANDAAEAIRLAEEEGLAPYSIAQASVPAFKDLKDANFIWGTYSDPSQARFQQLVCWASHMTGFMTTGYCGAGVYRRINKSLYESIPSSDVRKKWWLDGSGKAPASLPSNYASYISSGYKTDGNEAFPPYAQLKFGAYQDQPQASGAIDNVWLRVEELYLTEAEALGRINLGQGVSKLNSFVKTYRDPSYSKNPGSVEEFVDLVWWQRRVEFWGEGLAYPDIMRLQKGIDRRGGGYDPTDVMVISPNDPVLLYDIPQSEIERNPLIVDGVNGAVQPVPVDDID